MSFVEARHGSVNHQKIIYKKHFVRKALFANNIIWLQTKATFWFRNNFFSGKYTDFIKGDAALCDKFDCICIGKYAKIV